MIHGVCLNPLEVSAIAYRIFSFLLDCRLNWKPVSYIKMTPREKKNSVLLQNWSHYGIAKMMRMAWRRPLFSHIPLLSRILSYVPPQPSTLTLPWPRPPRVGSPGDMCRPGSEQEETGLQKAQESPFWTRSWGNYDISQRRGRGRRGAEGGRDVEMRRVWRKAKEKSLAC